MPRSVLCGRVTIFKDSSCKVHFSLLFTVLLFALSIVYLSKIIWLHEPDQNYLQNMVGVTGLKPATSRSQTARAINCATPRYALYHTGDHSLPEQSMVGVTGFEPATSPSRTVRATKLRHTPRYKTLPSYHTIWQLVYCLAIKTNILTSQAQGRPAIFI